MLNRSRPSIAPRRARAAPAPGGLRAVAPEARHLRRVRQIVAAAPAINVHVGAMLPPPLAARIAGVAHWAVMDGPRTIGLAQQHRGFCWAVDFPDRADPRLAVVLADLLQRHLRCSETVYGPESEVNAVLDQCKGAALEIIEIRQQLMMTCPPPQTAATHPAVGGFVLRPGVRADLKWLLTTHGAMCREDLGVDQVARNPEGYARYFGHLARQRRVVVGELHGRPVFKAEIALESREAWLIEGVYTAPEARGRGCATRAMSWLAEMARDAGREACLYVNRRNTTAIGVYERVGFRGVSPWATALVVHGRRR